MRIVTSLFDSIHGIYWFPVIAVFIFLIIFVAMTIHTLTLTKSYEEDARRMPFDADEIDNIREL